MNRKREIKFNINNYQIKYGSLNKETAEVIYIRVKSKIRPIEKKNSYNEDINLLKKDFIKKIHELIKSNNKIEKKYICHFETNEFGMSYNRNSFIKYELYIKPKEIKHVNEYKNDIVDFINLINQELNLLLNKYNIIFI